jgi:hypothetical protein
VGGIGGRCAIGRQHRHEDQQENREEVFDDEPADGDVALRGREDPIVHEDAEQDDGARDCHCHSKDQAGLQLPAEEPEHKPAEGGSREALEDGARDRDVLHGEQVFEVEMEPDAEHEQDDAEFGELVGGGDIADEAGGVGADDDAGEEVAHDRRQADALGKKS